MDGKNAEKARLHLIGQDLIAYGCRIHQEGGMVTFPVKDTTSPAHLEGIGHIGASLVQFEHVVPDTFGWNSLAKNLEGIIDADEVKHLITSFDVIGDIAAIEIPYPNRKNISLPSPPLPLSHFLFITFSVQLHPLPYAFSPCDTCFLPFLSFFFFFFSLFLCLFLSSSLSNFIHYSSSFSL